MKKFKICIFLIFTIFIFISLVKAWGKEDYEIFDLVDDLENAEGKDVTFYSWLGIEPTAGEKEVNKAYRKLSLTIHPDKNPGKDSKEKFSRLSLIGAILRNSESRERYDFFLKNGVPKWRGTGYYYSRHRPGLSTVVMFLLMLSSLLHYVIMWINYYQDKQRIRFYIRGSREIAWGKKMKKQNTKKKILINEKKFIVDSEDVFLLTKDGEELILDENEIEKPKILNVFVFSNPVLIYKKLIKQKYDTKINNVNDRNINDKSRRRKKEL